MVGKEKINDLKLYDLSDPFFKVVHQALIQGLFDPNQVRDILKTVPAKLIKSLFVSDQRLQSKLAGPTHDNESGDVPPTQSDGTLHEVEGDITVPLYTSGLGLADNDSVAKDDDLIDVKLLKQFHDFKNDDQMLISFLR